MRSCGLKRYESAASQTSVSGGWEGSQNSGERCTTASIQQPACDVVAPGFVVRSP